MLYLGPTWYTERESIIFSFKFTVDHQKLKRMKHHCCLRFPMMQSSQIVSFQKIEFGFASKCVNRRKSKITCSNHSSEVGRRSCVRVRWFAITASTPQPSGRAIPSSWDWPKRRHHNTTTGMYKNEVLLAKKGRWMVSFSACSPPSYSAAHRSRIAVARKDHLPEELVRFRMSPPEDDSLTPLASPFFNL